MRIVEGRTCKTMERCGEHHASSHYEDKSKYLKHDQIVVLSEAVRTAQALSAAELRYNMQPADPNSAGKKIGLELLHYMQ